MATTTNTPTLIGGIRLEHRAAGDEASLRAWLSDQGVTGYQQMLLVMETFGYPEFLLATAGEPGQEDLHDAADRAAYLRRRAADYEDAGRPGPAHRRCRADLLRRAYRANL